MTAARDLHLTTAERARVDHVDLLVASDPVPIGELLAVLDDPSWSVRRAGVSALASLGDDGVAELCRWLGEVRTTEHGIAAAIDALVTSRGATTNAAVIALCGHPQTPVIEDAARILGRRGASEAVTTLGALLAHPSDNVALAAIEALGAIGGAGTVEDLVVLIRTRNFFRTFPAMQVAARTGDPRVIGALAELLDDELYRPEAIRALGHTGSALAVAPLTALVEREAGATVGVVAEALTELVSQAARSGASSQVVSTVHAMLAPLRDRFVVALATARDRVPLLNVLGMIGDAGTLAVLAGSPEPAAVRAIEVLARRDEDALLIALASADPALRLAGLPLASSARVAPAVRAALADDEPEIRARACEALARIGDVTAVDALFAMLDDPSPRVGHAATAAIGALGVAGTAARVIAVLRSGSTRVRRHALRLVAYLGSDGLFDAVVGALGDPDPRIAELAVAALVSLGDPRVDATLATAASSASETVRAAAVRAAGQRRLESIVTRGLDDDSARVRYCACQALGQLGDARHSAALVARLADAAPQVRIAAIEAIARLDTPETWQILVSVAHSQNPDEQRAALIGIAGHDQPVATDILLAAARAPELATRLFALSGLVRSRDPRALVALGAALHDDHEAVRDAALSLLDERDDRETSELLLATAAITPDPAAPIHAAVSRARPIRIATIAERLATADAVEARALAAALGRMADPRATAALFGALAAPSAAARREAALTLVAIGAPGAIAAATDLARRDPDPDVRHACAAAVKL